MAFINALLSSMPPNFGMGDTFSWVGVENDQNRPLFARAMYLVNPEDIQISLSGSEFNIGHIQIGGGNDGTLLADVIDSNGGYALRVVTQPSISATITNTAAISGSVTITNPVTAVNATITNTAAVSGSVTIINPVTAVNATITNAAAISGTVNVSYADGPNIDAFGKLRTSTPYTLFDSKTLHNKQSLFWSQAVSGTGVVQFTGEHDASVTLSATNVGHFAIRQTTQRFNYQPGKALRNGEPVLTPTGWVPIETLNVGDKVFDGLGNVTDVVGVYPQGKRKLYRFTFDDETYVDADEEHLWVTVVRNDNKHLEKGNKRILTTKQMLEEAGSVPDIWKRWRIPGPPTLKMEHTPVEIDPYTLGAILGDGYISDTGSISFTTADEEMLDYLVCQQISKRKSKYGYGLLGLSEAIKKYNLEGKIFNTKSIPDVYKFNSEHIRLEVLRGLMDTDGWVERDHCTYYASGSKQLAEDVCFLVRSLGGTAKIKTRKEPFYLTKNGVKVVCSISYKVVVIIPVNPFKLKRKAEKWRYKWRTSFDRYVYSIKEIEEDEATCIRVASEDHTFLTRNNIVTHNSQLAIFTGVLTPVSNAIKRYGLFTSLTAAPYEPTVGLYFETQTDSASSIAVVQQNSTNLVPSVSARREDWNIDKLDGNGPSRKTLHLSAANIFLIDYEWLGVGRVRFGTVLDGQICYCHQINNAGNVQGAYIKSPNLPVRAEIRQTGAGTASMKVICCSVMSEGGADFTGVTRATDSGPKLTISTDLRRAILGVRLQANKLDSVNEVINASSICLTNNNATQAAYKYEILHNPFGTGYFGVSGGTWTDVDPNSNFQYWRAAAGGNEPFNGTVITSGYGAIGSTIDLSGFRFEKFLRMGCSVAGQRDEVYLVITPLEANNGVLGSLTFIESD